MTIEKYETKKVTIEAMQYKGTETCAQDVLAWTIESNTPAFLDDEYRLKIKTLEGDHLVSKNDYVIKGLRGEFYSCKPDIFHKKYKLVTFDKIQLPENPEPYEQVTVKNVEGKEETYHFVPDPDCSSTPEDIAETNELESLRSMREEVQNILDSITLDFASEFHIDALKQIDKVVNPDE